MAEEYKLGAFALLCVATVALVLAWLDGPVWYAVGPLIVYAAYLIKLKVRRIRDKPMHIVAILAVVSLAMIGFAAF